ncbi:MAG: D-alanyl-D-alanine carboxypeptidase [Candidatus Magasanikbacteria bacterium]|nr:D-alanyl-D-alanine carboxypeptidase [Candidatus Magasanikbacteria bacterium]
MKLQKLLLLTGFLAPLFFEPAFVFAQADFNPHFIISDPELQDYQNWTSSDIQKFLDDKGSYLRNLVAEDANGMTKMASDIIYNAAQLYKVNPKFLLVTLQKEQSLITDDTPTQKQLDWATGYAVCDSCSMDDPKVMKYKGFGKQVDGSAGIMRWYYDNEDKTIVKKKDTPIRIDGEDVTPQSWATAFLYTYTPHLHGNKNFWRIWNTWFEQVYPNGTLLTTDNTTYWLIQEGKRRQFKNKTALITRVDPKIALLTSETDLMNYTLGAEISFPNYSLLKTSTKTYLLDYDTLRPFASDEVVAKLGYNPDEPIDVADTELAGYAIGSTITASTTAPQGIIFQITDAAAYYLLKDDVLSPILDKAVIDANYKNLRVEKHKLKELAKYTTANEPVVFSDGTLLRAKDSSIVYVIDHGAKRPIADDDTFIALGYKRSNIVPVAMLSLLNIPLGKPLFMNKDFTSAKNKYLGDNATPVTDLYGKTTLPAYVIAEYPSGRIVSGKDVDTRRPIASLTKLLTAYEALHQDLNLNKTTAYETDRYATDENPLKLQDGDIAKNKDLFYAMLVGSVNSAARMIAQSTGLEESEFVQKVNARLDAWGADFTTIADVTGLDERNKSTPRDLLKIFTKVLTDKTVKDALARPTYIFRKTTKKRPTAQTLKNTNQIFALYPAGKRGYKILATKTGYTEEANAVLIMLIESKKTKKRHIIVTMGNPNYAKRFEEPHKLAQWIATQK